MLSTKCIQNISFCMTKSYLSIVFCILAFQFPHIFGEAKESLVRYTSSEIYSQLSTENEDSDEQANTAQDAASDTNFALPIPKVNLSVEDDLNPKQLTLGPKTGSLADSYYTSTIYFDHDDSFTRIVIVLSFTRRAIGTQTLPSDKLLVSLALFLTIFTWHLSGIRFKKLQ